jgi:hypothetical protein
MTLRNVTRFFLALENVYTLLAEYFWLQKRRRRLMNEVMKIGDYDVQVLELATDKNNGLKYYPVLMDLFDGNDWKGHKRVYVAKTMPEGRLRRTLEENPYIVEQLFGLCDNQRITLSIQIDIIKHKNFPQKVAFA